MVSPEPASGEREVVTRDSARPIRRRAPVDRLVVGYSSRLGPISEVERELLTFPGVDLVEMDLMTEDRIVAASRRADYLIVGAVEPITRDTLLRMDPVRLIVRRGAGFDNVDVDAATERGIAVAHVPDASVEEVSDHALALMLALIRRVTEIDRLVRNGVAARERLPVEEIPRLSEMTVGVVGLGRIGSRFAEKAGALFAEVIGYDKAGQPVEGVRWTELDELLRTADAVSVHVPLTPDTRHLFDRRAFGAMKPGSVLVNTSRGEVIDEVALDEALASGRLSGAGLDVLVEDPPSAEHRLLVHDNVVVTAHTAGRGASASLALRRRSVEAVVAALHGRYPEVMLNREVWRQPPSPHLKESDPERPPKEAR